MPKKKPEYDGTLFDLDYTPVKPVPTKSVTIFTDGACCPNPGHGGWAAIILDGDQKNILQGREPNTTNNRMELQAAIEGLSSFAEPYRVQLFTDSEYLRDGITDWLPRWELRGWMTMAKTPVKNTDLWQALSRLTKLHDIEWCWVKAHNGDANNEECDRLAEAQARLQRTESESE
jgi:ribonuclease HI